MVEFYDLKYPLKAKVPHVTMLLYSLMNIMRQCFSKDSCPFKIIKNRTFVARNSPEWNYVRLSNIFYRTGKLNDWSLFLNYTFYGLFLCELILIANSREWFWDLCDLRGTSVVTDDRCCDWPPVEPDGCSLLSISGLISVITLLIIL